MYSEQSSVRYRMFKTRSPLGVVECRIRDSQTLRADFATKFGPPDVTLFETQNTGIRRRCKALYFLQIYEALFRLVGGSGVHQIPASFARQIFGSPFVTLFGMF